MSSRTAQQWLEHPTVPDTHYVAGSVYSDPEILVEEKAKIFGKLWTIACHESEVAQPFDFRTLDYAGTPLLIVRGGDGRIRTFVNVCSHRGAKLVNEPSGNAKTFVCFYHYWAYDPQGSCVNIPKSEAYEGTGLDKKNCGLREIKTEVRLGIVFINLDDTPGSLDDYIGDALEPFREAMTNADLEVFHYQRAVIRANWKAWMETNMDAYHTVMHVVLRKTQVDSTRQITIHPHGHVSSGGVKAAYDKYKGWSGRESSLALPGMDVNELRVANLFPNATVLSRGTVMRIDVVRPISAHEMALESRGLGVKGDSEEDRVTRFKHHNMYWGPFSRNWPEDAFAAEACEKAFSTGAARYQIIAREEGLRGQDDGSMRTFYATWGQHLGRPPHNPSNRAT